MRLLIDVHVHSCFSKDSNSKLESIISFAEKNGLDAVAICDHDTVEGGIEGLKVAKKLGSKITVIPGIEVTSTKGHILVLGVDKNIEPHLTPEETIKAARKSGGVVIVPHPFKISSQGIGFVDGIDIDAVEVLNSRCFTDKPNDEARRAAQLHNIPEAGGSDSHIPDTVGQTYTIVEVSENTPEAIISAIKNGTISAGGKKVPVSVVFKHTLSTIKRKVLQRLR
ncbi:PHP domain protein [Methanohalobium evestigatum Z-7303]|uniref:PHP domain protein n=1 Tax=Methanohalobium evestigatum (strain ATCC BAA-1072 / DSM 3721 / NBRC 107634 / OCM 161 / Z-7303) TaxID=644295 RepID=D7E8B9_METEZ|nr:PHP domain-containing protein [Methanohalobium evestigatum]ADI73461.1 PHP domain protein [Methanohalobium evestigatum Z-7303]